MATLHKDQTQSQKLATSLVKGFLSKSEALEPALHGGTKGQYRELFISGILSHFLSSQFSIGSGIITNARGDLSTQTDIIIYDNRILPPMFSLNKIGIYPAEGVVGIIEIKSNITKNDIKDIDKAAGNVRNKIYNLNRLAYDYSSEIKEIGIASNFFKPFCALFTFDGRTLSSRNDNDNRQFFKKNVINLNAVCICNKSSWLKLSYWVPDYYDKKLNKYDYIKRFFVALLDNIRTISNIRYELFLRKPHRDWLGIYTRAEQIEV